MNLNQMYKSGLFINDFALHDSSRDLVLASTQQAAELKLLLHQVCRVLIVYWLISGSTKESEYERQHEVTEERAKEGGSVVVSNAPPQCC